jgi:topoisomerase-4 subunit B
VADEIFAGNVKKEGGHGSVEWAVAWFGGAEGFVNSYCNTVPTPEGGTHEQGLRLALARSLKNYAELSGKKRGSMITTDDVMISAGIMLSVFIREPEFVRARPRTSSPPSRPRALSTRQCRTISTTG